MLTVFGGDGRKKNRWPAICQNKCFRKAGLPDFPGPEMAAPDRELGIPQPETIIPDQGTAIPGREVPTPAQETAAAGRETINPGRGATNPDQKMAFLHRGIAFLDEEMTFPDVRVRPLDQQTSLVIRMLRTQPGSRPFSGEFTLTPSHQRSAKAEVTSWRQV